MWSLMNITDLIKKYELHDMTLNHVDLDKNNRKITLDVDYWLDESKNHLDTSVNLSLNFYDCFSWNFEGDTTLINYKGNEISGSILTADVYRDSNYTQQGIKLFIQIDNYTGSNQDYLTLILFPEEIKVTMNCSISRIDKIV